MAIWGGLIKIFQGKHHPRPFTPKSFTGIETSGGVLGDFLLGFGEKGWLIIIRDEIRSISAGGGGWEGVDVELNFCQCELVGGDDVGKFIPFLLAGEVHFRQLWHEHPLDKRLEHAHNFTLVQIHIVIVI